MDWNCCCCCYSHLCFECRYIYIVAPLMLSLFLFTSLTLRCTLKAIKMANRLCCDSCSLPPRTLALPRPGLARESVNFISATGNCVYGVRSEPGPGAQRTATHRCREHGQAKPKRSLTEPQCMRCFFCFCGCWKYAQRVREGGGGGWIAWILGTSGRVQWSSMWLGWMPLPTGYNLLY